MEHSLENLKKILNEFSEVAAAYLFGSAAGNESVVNDIDLLVLLYSGINMYRVYFDLTDRIANSQGVSTDKVDILFFDLQTASPEVLYEAVNKGILLKNNSPEFLNEKIEDLSSYLVENEFLIKESKELTRQRLEEFCVD